MNVFNVHVNRYPVDGVVSHVQYNKGKFINAAAEKSSLENEQMSVGIELGEHRILVRQIAGLIARRIVTYSKAGEVVQSRRPNGNHQIRLARGRFHSDGSQVRPKLAI